jgi:hypothetical protein
LAAFGLHRSSTLPYRLPFAITNTPVDLEMMYSY